MILNIISKSDIVTQEDLARALKNAGISITQATVSRDIKELRLIKVLSHQTGVYKYATSETSELWVSDRFLRMFTESIVSISHSGNLIVIKTLPGSANVAGETIDSMHWPEVLETLAGDNTVLLIVRSEEDVKTAVNRIHNITNSMHEY